jgi:hypothetical protein
LKKWLSASRRSKRARKQGQNATKTAYSAPESGTQEGVKGFFNKLGCSPNFGFTEFSEVRVCKVHVDGQPSARCCDAPDIPIG